MKRFIDEKFNDNKWKYIRQSILVTLFIGIILVFFDFVARFAITACLGATCFIIFTAPHKNSSKPRYILGLGYLVGAVVGCVCVFFGSIFANIPMSIWGAVAIGISMLLMVVFNFEHPPASALSLGIVMEGFNTEMMITVFIITVFLLVVRRLLKKWLIDLI